MEFTLFMIFSLLETFALYFFMFRLFKLDLHLPSILFAALIGSYISYTLRITFDMTYVDIAIQILLVIGFFWLLFQIPFYYSILIVCTCYVAYVFVQIPIYYLFTSTVVFPDEIVPTAFTVYIVQLLTSAFIISVGWLLHKRRIGFSFIPHSSFISVKLKNYQIALLILYFITFCSVPAAYFLLQFSPFFSLTPLVIGLLLLFCLYAAYRSDRKYD
jgi:hypothetical protein